MARVWNLLALLFTGLTVLACVCMSAIFVFPQAPFNPFPPERDSQLTLEMTPTDIVFPTSTAIPTLGELPPEYTATPGDGQPPALTKSAPVTETPNAPQNVAPPTFTNPPPLDLASPTPTLTPGGYPGAATNTPASSATPTATVASYP
jgi:hypothetical protein